MGARGDFSNFRKLKASLRAMPVTIAHDVARRAAPDMTTLTQQAFNSSTTVYDRPRPLGVDGQPLKLRRTGTVEGQLRFVALGTQTRAVLGPRYARYLIGKYDILPNGPIPAKWRERLAELVSDTRGVLP